MSRKRYSTPEIPEASAPGTPAANFVVGPYAKSDGRLYAKDDAGVEFALGGTRIIRIVIDGGGSVITTGAKKVYLSVPYDCTITKWRLLAAESGSIVLDVWKDTYANFPPVVGDSIILAGTKPTLSSAQKAEDSTMASWLTKVLTAGDVIEVNVDSVTTITKVYLDFFVT